jgi:2-keto-4-pentenoate hydratase/2-oxohepta-3-ene-1,7-dioic acid hydratase in catechol pathway
MENVEEYILGYGLGIDVTARDLQNEAKKAGNPWSISKGFDTFAPISRFRPPEEFDHINEMDIKLEVNEEVRQHGNTRDMIYSVDQLIAYLSTIFTLHPGDLIFTGTPEGVSKIEDGDLIRATLGDNQIDLNVSAMHEPSFE